MRPVATLSIALAGAVVFAVAGAAVAQDDDERPGAPREFEAPENSAGVVELSWVRSTDDTGIAAYRLWRNGRLVTEFDDAVTTPSPSSEERRFVTELPHGPAYLQLQAVDGAGNESVKTAPVYVEVDREQPAAPVDLAVDQMRVDPRATRVFLRFRLPSPRDVVTCTLLRNLGPTPTGSFVPVPDPDGATRFVVSGRYESNPGQAGPADPVTGTRDYFQLFCTDAVGNDSVRSAPLFAPGIPELE